MRLELYAPCSTPAPGDEAGLAVREEIERLAQQHSGEYDGSETALSE